MAFGFLVVNTQLVRREPLQWLLVGPLMLQWLDRIPIHPFKLQGGSGSKSRVCFTGFIGSLATSLTGQFTKLKTSIITGINNSGITEIVVIHTIILIYSPMKQHLRRKGITRVVSIVGQVAKSPIASLVDQIRCRGRRHLVCPIVRLSKSHSSNGQI
jgi:hypothetical protein